MNRECYYRISVKAICFDENDRILLAREDNGMWDILGGGLEHGEEPIACLRREIQEESGLEVISISEQPKYFVTAPRLNHDTFMANVIYEVKFKDLNFTRSAECEELRYFTLKEARKEKLFPTITALIDEIERQRSVS